MPTTLVCSRKKVLCFVKKIEIHAPATKKTWRGTGRGTILSPNDANSRQVTTSQEKIECLCYLRLNDKVN